MRSLPFLVCLAIAGSVTHASAADYGMPVLRGSSVYEPEAPSYYRWSGLYGGVSAGYVAGVTEFSDAVRPAATAVVASIPDNGAAWLWPTQPKANAAGSSYGAFAGYNVQFDDAVVGFELGYHRPSFNSTADYRVQRPGGARVDAREGLDIKDYLNLRGRAGWAFGAILPYATLGAVVGRADRAWSATGNVGGLNPNPRAETHADVFIYGFSAGGGVDVALLQNLFVRAEYEYVHFTQPTGVNAGLHTARVGAGLKY
jgi:opacity protein-like surface antigen